MAPLLSVVLKKASAPPFFLLLENKKRLLVWRRPGFASVSARISPSFCLTMLPCAAAAADNLQAAGAAVAAGRVLYALKLGGDDSRQENLQQKRQWETLQNQDDDLDPQM